MNNYKLDRFEGAYAILIQEDAHNNEISVLKERLIAFAKPGDFIKIDFDNIGNLKHVEIISKVDKMEKA
ncbi:DUF3006 family protein [Halobacillus halophilus]|uniref:Uncharacterized protein n=2 Tax=Halobacillus TaxID=45667 RepID=I0JJG2_HALH3|nr:DUF3006 family protein [Halobacillus halophilus]ASF38439.1 hypothetical protein CEH05_04610 [Halobacillus halophilus]MCA1010143.1 DUF3006 family protein [Halobacillus halophilus]CCG44280.1 hypothetical protein HBHAL_1918 [Halobacillus halophilus DSM 2266]